MRSLNVVLSWVIKWSIMALQLKNDKKYKQENSGQGCEEIHQQCTQLHHQSRTDTVINHQSCPTHWLTQEESIWKKVWSMKRSKASFFQARRVYWYPLRLLNSWMQAR